MGFLIHWKRHSTLRKSSHSSGPSLPPLRNVPQAENARLKKMLAERDLEIDVMKEIAAKKW